MPQNLYKSRTNKIIDGVCGGLGEYLNIDPTLIRLVLALAIFLGGTGVILYIVAMIIIPANPIKSATTATSASTPKYADEGDGQEKPIEDQTTEANAQPSKSENGNTPQADNGERAPVIIGLILIAFGAYYLLNRFFPFLSFRYWWPVLLIILGVFVITRSKGGTR